MESKNCGYRRRDGVHRATSSSAQMPPMEILREIELNRRLQFALEAELADRPDKIGA